MLKPIHDLLAARNYENLEGSLITAENIHDPSRDSHIYLEKRLNYVMLLDQLGCGRLLEIGFNWGYSGSLLLESSPSSRLHSIDIAHHWYTPPTGEAMQAIYPDRFTFTWNDSKQAMLDELAAGHRYDMVSVDGGHDYLTAKSDILLGVELLNDGGLLIVDDTDGPSVAGAVLATVANHPDMVELTAQNFGLFEFGTSDIPCFEQRYFLKRAPLTPGFTAPRPTATPVESEPPQPQPGLLQRIGRKLDSLLGA